MSCCHVSSFYEKNISRFLAGSLAGSTGQLITYPLDRARAVMAVTNSSGSQYKNLVFVFVSIYKEEGFLSLYRGLTPTLLGVIPYAGTSFFTYETLKGWTVARRGGDHSEPLLPSPVERMSCGAVAGLLGQAASYPLDIVRWVSDWTSHSSDGMKYICRRRMQTSHQLGKGEKYNSVLGTLVTVYR